MSDKDDEILVQKSKEAVIKKAMEECEGRPEVAKVTAEFFRECIEESDDLSFDNLCLEAPEDQAFTEKDDTPFDND